MLTADNWAIGPDVGLSLTTGRGNLLIGEGAGAGLTTECNRLVVTDWGMAEPYLVYVFLHVLCSEKGSMQPVKYISNAAFGSGLPRYGERDELCDAAAADGYEVYYTGKESDPDLWLVKPERCVGMADVIHISRLFTMVEWSKLSQKFRMASAVER